MRVHRLVRILTEIDRCGKVKAQNLAETLEVSDRTIYRDIDVLCEAGYPILTTTGQSGGIFFAEGYKLNTDQTEDMLKTLLSNLYTLPEQERLIQALENGMGVKYGGRNGLRSENRQRILLDQKSWWEDDVIEIDLQPIIKALFQQQKIAVQYTHSDGTVSDRILAPYGLVLKYTTWYLIAFCYSREEVRTFQCARIENITLLPETYKIPADFVLKKYWNFSMEGFKKSRTEQEYYPVAIKVPRALGEIFRRYEVIGMKQDGEDVIGMVNLHRKDIAEEEIRAFLGYGQIIYPEEMIKRAGALLKRNLEIYDSAAADGISQIKMRFDPEQKEESNPLH